MRIGRLDRKITIQRSATVKNSFNEDELTWADLYPNLWAGYRAESGKEVLASDQRVASNTVVFTIHYREVKPSDRVLYQGTAYDIQSLNEIGRRKGLEIIATSKDNG